MVVSARITARSGVSGQVAKEGMVMQRTSVKRRRLRLPILISLVIVLLVGGAPVFAAAETFTASTKFPIDIIVFVPCANGGAGELVELTGSLHDLFHMTIDDTGGL